MSLGKSISNRIYELRLSKHLTQETLAEKAGMDVNALGRIERGQNYNIKVETLDKIINALEVDYNSFFSFQDQENNYSKIISKLSLVNDQEKILDVFDKILDIELDKNN
ncbi:helix-turn-helix domain-containing protein [Streptococcus parauberis]|uniref:DNA-binding helix-turn-helix protein n=1 Tax=Streptococcus parauberis NCFD 2020 TaxID=873447 RepID=F1YXU9_9STRE|nr:helix-turn-helix transcriptional regulator [Streptococcus parauberis]EGE53199.1 DNA-binding helix-turn-helix protein [Streptococcus parauberis NCFD 2020]